MDRGALKTVTGGEIRQLCRRGEWDGPTAGLAEGYVQANLVVLPAEHAFDFWLFCRRNSRACPVLDVTGRGEGCPLGVAPDADLRTDLPRYRIFRQGEQTEETTSIVPFWREDAVAFLLGCSFTFESALRKAGLPVRHIELARNVPMYRTNRSTCSVGVFGGPLVVSMRPMTPAQANRAIEVTARYPSVHGAPIHMGDPSVLGIEELDCPDFGEAVPIEEGEVPVFWACGVTSQEVVVRSKIAWAVTHAPGHMFLTDWCDENLETQGADGVGGSW